MRESEVFFPSGPLRLAGTVTWPRQHGQVPLVITIAGSGPVDRDSNAPGHRINIFNDMAAHLAEAGVASLRYDKRGTGSSAGDFLHTGHHDLVDDAIAAIRFVLLTYGPKISSVVLVGHSEGAVIAPQAAVRTAGVNGVVMMCPFLRPFGDILEAQARQVEREMGTQPGIDGWINRLNLRWFDNAARENRRVMKRILNSDEPVMRMFGNHLNAKGFRELLQVDTAQVYQRLPVPSLVVGAEKDLQCPPEDVPAIEAVIKAPVTSLIVPELTHLLRKTPHAPRFADYQALLEHPVDGEVLSGVTGWVTENFRN